MPKTDPSADTSKGNLRHLINHIIKVIFLDDTILQGELKGFDSHMNLLLTNCTEIENTASKSKKKQMGFVLVRGEQILATSVVSSPLISQEEKQLIQKKKLEQLELKLKREKLDKLKRFEKKKQKSIGGLQKSLANPAALKKKGSSDGKKPQGKKSKIDIALKKKNEKPKKNTATKTPGKDK